MKPLAWLRSPTGRLVSEGTRFLIDFPHTIKALTFVQVGNGYALEERVVLVDRRGGLKRYLCLSVAHAMTCAGDLAAGRGVMADQ